MKVTSEQCRMYFHHAQFPRPSEFMLSSGLGDFAQPTTSPHNPSASVVHGAGNSPVLPWALTVTSRKEEQGRTAWSSHSNSSSHHVARQVPCRGHAAQGLGGCCHTHALRCFALVGWHGTAQDLAGVHHTCLLSAACCSALRSW